MSELVPVAALAPAPMSYRDRLTQFKILEEKRFELIEELLEKLEKTEGKLTQMELDLASEQNVRRTLQAEVVETKAALETSVTGAKTREDDLVQKQSRRPFVLALVDADADGFLFQDKYITRKAQGGEMLADELLIRIREYIRPMYEDADTVDIIVRVYANLEGLANLLVRQERVRNLGQLRAFSTGFCGRISSFDWIDVGVGKEGNSGRKVRENLSFYTSNSHLRHVILGCSPNDLPPNLLSALPLDKLTLIESLPLPPAITTLPLKVAKFPTLFPPPPAPKITRAHTREGGRSSAQLQLMQQEDDAGGSTWLVIQPERSRSQGRDRERERERERDRERDREQRDREQRDREQRRRRVPSEDRESSLSISIGPDNTVNVDSGRRRRVMG